MQIFLLSVHTTRQRVFFTCIMLRARSLPLRFSISSRLVSVVVQTQLHTRAPTMSKHPGKNNHQHLKSFIPQPPPGAKESIKKPFPETGWEGDLPSQEGGDKEDDFMNKPPYWWKSDKFEVKYTSSALGLFIPGRRD